MAFNFGAAFGGLAAGLGEGLPQGVQLRQRQDQIEIQQSELKLKIASSFANLKKMPLEMRKIVAPGLMDQFEKAYNIPIPETMRALAIKGEDAQWSKAMDVMSTYITTGKGTPAELSAAAKAFSDDPDQQLKFFATLSQRGESRERIAVAREELDVRKQELEREAARKAETASMQAHRDILDNQKDLTGPGRTDFETKLEKNTAYQSARQAGDTKAMYSIASKIRAGTSPENYATKGQTDLSVASELRDKYAKLAEQFPNKTEYADLRDRFDRVMRMGGKELPQYYVEFVQGATSVSKAINDLASKLADPAKANLTNFKDRADIRQSVANIITTYKNAERMGASFTPMERGLIDDAIGGNPNDVFSRMTRGREDFIEKLRKAHEVITGKAAAMESAIIKGRPDIEKFPVTPKAPQKSDAQNADEVLGLLDQSKRGPTFVQQGKPVRTMPFQTEAAEPSRAAPLPRMSGGQIDRAKLKVGEIYQSPNGKLGRWNGAKFEEIR